jgi:hypothetical protein
VKKLQILVLAFVLFSTTAFAQRKYVGWSYGYLPNYANFSVSKVNWKCYTILAWFSINGNGSGTVTGMTDAAAKTFTTTCHQNNTKAIICVGGAGAGGAFQSATQTSVMPTFVHNIVDFMKRNSFDGVDIDWEDGINGQFVPFMKMLNDTVIKTTPKPLVTIATAQYLAASHAPAAPYVDQLNLMSYYDLLNSSSAPISGQVASLTSRGVPKSKIGVGYGYDTDNEVDGPNECGNGPDGNPGDINGKILYAIDNACGGIMIWEIDRAPAKCDSVTAYYCIKNAPIPVLSLPMATMPHGQRVMFAIVNNGVTGESEIRYSVPSAEVVNLELFNMKGAVVQILANGKTDPGRNYVIPLGKNDAGISITPGAYVVKMTTPASTEAGMVFVK